MSYFAENYTRLLYPVGSTGFRHAQLAAVQSVAAHFFANKAPAIVVMPKQVLLTATPFRRDSKEIKGKIVFTYDVRRAYEDKIFGDLTFRPAQPTDGESIDQAIAREALRQSP